MKLLTKASVTTLLLLSSFASGHAIAFGDDLGDIHENIKDKYDVNHISNDEFKAINNDEVIVFDVRKPSEYEVSHIDGAIRVDPGIKPEDFFAQYGEDLTGKNAVFYCSVGRRSSNLLSKVNDQLPDYGVKSAYNLQGGIFQWHNDQIDLVRNGENTRDIHPYNFYWGRLIDDRSAIEYSVTDN